MYSICSGHLHVFKNDYVYDVENTIKIVESDENGAGEAGFSVSGKAIQIRSVPGKSLILSLSHQKCADGAFLTFDNNNVHLHIVELKTTVRNKNWPDILKQFEGMFLCSVAIARLLGLDSISRVTCYLAHKHDKVNFANGAQLVLAKTPVGGRNTIGGVREWQTKNLNLPFKTSASIILGVMTGANNVADFGAVV